MLLVRRQRMAFDICGGERHKGYFVSAGLATWLHWHQLSSLSCALKSRFHFTRVVTGHKEACVCIMIVVSCVHQCTSIHLALYNDRRPPLCITRSHWWRQHMFRWRHHRVRWRQNRKTTAPRQQRIHQQQWNQRRSHTPACMHISWICR